MFRITTSNPKSTKVSIKESSNVVVTDRITLHGVWPSDGNLQNKINDCLTHQKKEEIKELVGLEQKVVSQSENFLTEFYRFLTSTTDEVSFSSLNRQNKDRLLCEPFVNKYLTKDFIIRMTYRFNEQSDPFGSTILAHEFIKHGSCGCSANWPVLPKEDISSLNSCVELFINKKKLQRANEKVHESMYSIVSLFVRHFTYTYNLFLKFKKKFGKYWNQIIESITEGSDPEEIQIQN
jgi:hypothetical protein